MWELSHILALNHSILHSKLQYIKSKIEFWLLFLDDIFVLPRNTSYSWEGGGLEFEDVESRYCKQTIKENEKTKV